jgi:uncharacterized membrane protein
MVTLLASALEASLAPALVLAVSANRQALRKEHLGACLCGAASAVLVAWLRVTWGGFSYEWFTLVTGGLVIGASIWVVIALLTASSWGAKTNVEVRPGSPDEVQHPPRTARLISVPALQGLLILHFLPQVIAVAGGIVAPNSTLFSSDSAAAAAGYALGLALVASTAWAWYRVAQRSPFYLVIALLVMLEAVTCLQVLAGRRMLPNWPGIYSATIWLVNHQVWISYAMVAVCFISLFLARPEPPVQHQASNPAERRLHRAAAISRRRFLTGAAAGIVAAVVIPPAASAGASGEVALSEAEPLDESADEVSVPLERINDGHLHRFAYTSKAGIEVRFIAIQKNERAYGVGLDACNVCGPTGYYERDGKVICKLCDVAMNIPTIGFKGGCNPIPIKYAVQEGKLVVAKEVLESSAEVFA